MGEDDFKQAWQPVIDRIGEDVGGEEWRGADVIDPSAVRRYCEPLELDCPLHHDPEVAREHGHADLVAPYTSVTTFTLPPVWAPGEPTAWASDERDGQPRHSVIANLEIPGAPETTGFFATDFEADFVRPPAVGDRLRKVGQRIVSCVPKETAVGCGAFVTIESEIRTEDGDELVATTRLTTFSYNPK